MYSDVWMNIDGYQKSSPIHINSVVDIHKWINKQNEPIGICVDFELADDVHYELRIEEWNRFLNSVLQIEDTDDFIKPFQKFLSIPLPQITFGEILNSNNIEFNKIAFY